MKRKPIAQPVDERETAERLLDAAERLFGVHGYDGVGMRTLAEEAGVNLGAATYHFGSKEALYVETFMRRFRPTNAERLRLLQKAEARSDGKPLPVERIVECMIRPPFESGLEHPAFQLFLARNLFMPPPFLHAAIHKELEPGMRVFIAALRRALPDQPEDLLHMRTMFAMGGLLMFSMRAGEIPGMRNPQLHEVVMREMVAFMTAGLQSAPAVSAKDRPRLPFPPKLPRK
jgi:AcrR family transcriptional regulator